MEVRDAVFGNVGSIIAFRMSADDARTMLQYFEPKFEEHDLVHMHNRHFVVSMTIEGEKVQAFSAISLNLPPWSEDHSAEIIEHSRQLFAIGRYHVEKFVNERYLNANERPIGTPEKGSSSKLAEKSEPKTTLPQPKAMPAPSLARTAVSGVVENLPTADEAPKKRKRRRKRKPADGASQNPNSQTTPKPSSSTEKVVQLR